MIVLKNVVCKFFKNNFNFLTGNKSNDCEENNFAIQRKKYRNNFDKSYLSIHSL